MGSSKLLTIIRLLLPKGRLRLWSLVLLMAMAVVMTLGYRDYLRYKNSTTASQGRHYKRLAMYFAKELTEKIEGLRSQLAATLESKAPAPGGFPFSPAQCGALGGREVSDAWVVNKDGTLFFSCSGRISNGEDLSRHPAFSRARGLSPGKVTGAGVAIGPRDATYFLALATNEAVALFPIPLVPLVMNTLVGIEEDHPVVLWIMGPEGTLLYHNVHPEMLGRNIFTGNGECGQCHEFFSPQRRMLARISGVENYKIDGRPNVAGFSSALILGEKWTVVIAEPIADMVSPWHLAIWWWISTILLFSALTVTVVVDSVSRRRERIFYEQMVHTEKLAALGRLVAGITHEVLNPLNVIKVSAQAAKTEKGLDEQVVEGLDTILRQVDRIVTLIDRMRKFSRKEKVGKSQPLDIRDLVEESLLLAGFGNRGNHVEVVKIFSDYLPCVEGNRDGLTEVMVNIMVNAYDAMQGNGTLKITVSPEGEGVSISFADNGPGIPKEIVGRIFDPFFTTKSPDKGTGLGLSLALGIVERHGGRISVESREGKGSTFIIWLPARA